VLPASFDPPNLTRLLSGHLCAVLGAGLFSAVSILALQGVLLSVLGERLFRRLSLLLQGLSISALLMLLLLFPVLSGAVPVLLQSNSPVALWCPPFWFLGVYQRLLEGPAALPIYARLAQTGCVALAVTLVVAMVAYPIAYVRRVRQLVVGSAARDTRMWAANPLNALLHATLLQNPVRRAVFHFISETLQRVQRYRIYLVLYGGVGLSVVVASVLRLTVAQGQVHAEVSADGVRAAMAIVVFWTIAGLRMAFVSPGNKQGSWVFRIVHGRPPELETALEELKAAQLWVLLWAVLVSLGACVVFCAIAPPELRGWAATVSLGFLAIALCVLLTDAFFLNVKTVAFTGETAREQPSLAMALLKYYTFFPIVIWVPVVAQPWLAASVLHFGLGIVVVAAAHVGFRAMHRRVIREHCAMPGLEDGEDDFPMKLGLRY
jgi:hypothetical protein